jgi:hypothetical protein
MSELRASATRLQKSAHWLGQRWADTSQTWQDQVSREFAEEFLWPIMPQIKLSLAAIQEMADVLDKAQRECEDRSA